MRSIIGYPRRLVRRAQSRRGFTLLELVLVAALSSVLFLILIRWTFSLNSSSSATMDSTSAQRSADVSRGAFADDVANTFTCLNYTNPVESLSPTATTFTVLLPANYGGSTVSATYGKVTWSIVADTGAPAGTYKLVRSFAPFPGCSSAGTTGSMAANSRVYAPIVDAPTTTNPGFYTVTSGRSSSDTVNCQVAADAGKDPCFATTIGMTWLFRSTLTAAPVALSRSYLFATTKEGLF